MSLNHGKQSAVDFAARVRENQRKLRDGLTSQYDFIVCGSGSSGSEPSSQLSQAIYFLSKAVHAIASQNGNFTLDGLHISLLEDRPAEDALDRLARRVLRSTLEQVRTQ